MQSRDKDFICANIVGRFMPMVVFMEYRVNLFLYDLAILIVLTPVYKGIIKELSKILYYNIRHYMRQFKFGVVSINNYNNLDDLM